MYSTRTIPFIRSCICRLQCNPFRPSSQCLHLFLNALGFPNALIYAGIWPLSIHGLGKFTKTGSSLLIMGLCGNAILPLVYGHFAEIYDLRIGYWVLIPCFLYLVFFAVKGHKITSWR